jgi:glutathione S-transferase
MPLRFYASSLSPFVRKVRITLYEKRIDFDAVEIERGAQRAELLRVNPRGEVPALVDGDVVVTGSSTICDYVEERFPAPPLLPAEPAARARCRTLERVADTQDGRAPVPDPSPQRSGARSSGPSIPRRRGRCPPR